MGIKFIEYDEKTISGIIKYKKQCFVEDREFFSEVTVLLRLYLLSPATNGISNTAWKVSK